MSPLLFALFITLAVVYVVVVLVIRKRHAKEIAAKDYTIESRDLEIAVRGRTIKELTEALESLDAERSATVKDAQTDYLEARLTGDAGVMAQATSALRKATKSVPKPTRAVANPRRSSIVSTDNDIVGKLSAAGTLFGSDDSSSKHTSHGSSHHSSGHDSGSSHSYGGHSHDSGSSSYDSGSSSGGGDW